jgi:hypothetical protein
VKSDEKRLLELFGRLGDSQQGTLIAFGEFLVTRASANGEAAPSVPDQPLPIARPDTETVVMAIKRLTQTYPMLDRRKLLGDTSKFVAQHALEGRPAVEVIDELEVVFSRHFEGMRDEE